MRPLLLALGLVVFGLPGVADSSRSTAGFLESGPCLLPGLAGLLNREPRQRMEVAAFVTEEDGSLVFLVWPITSWFRSQRYRGAIPAGTLALAHTHPPDSGERPSEQDVLEAERLMLPSYVVTRSSVWVVDPRAEPRVRRVAHRWLGGITAKPGKCARFRIAR